VPKRTAPYRSLSSLRYVFKQSATASFCAEMPSAFLRHCVQVVTFEDRCTRREKRPGLMFKLLECRFVARNRIDLVQYSCAVDRIRLRRPVQFAALIGKLVRRIRWPI
jgi:hypothetical protein